MEIIRGRGLAEVPEKTEDNREMLSQGTRCLGHLEPGTSQVGHSPQRLDLSYSVEPDTMLTDPQGLRSQHS
jgi:hypothetical protein